MAEVASDCSMSPGNLYRFFPGKLDIAEAIATEDYERHLEHLRKIAVAPGKDARQRLHDLLFEELRRTYHKLEKDPRAYEMATVIGMSGRNSPTGCWPTSARSSSSCSTKPSGAASSCPATRN
jgi:AcrR family transcriptional regulator